MKRRRKTAILLSIAVVLATAAVVFTVHLPGKMEQRVRNLRAEGRWAEAMQVQDRLVRLFPRSDAARIAVMGSQSNLSIGEPGVIVGANFVLGLGGELPSDPSDLALKLVSNLERLAHRQPMEMWRYNLIEDKAELLAQLEHWEQARVAMLEAIDGFETRGNDSRALDAKITMLKWVTDAQERLAEARNLLEADANYTQIAQIDLIIGNAARELERYEEARDAYTAAISAERESIAYANAAPANDEGRRPTAVLEEQPSYQAARFGLDHVQFLRSSVEEAALTGVVAGGGRPLEDIRIYLTPDDGRRGVSTSRVLERSYQTTTSARGEFELRGLPPGTYELAIGLPADLAARFGRTGVPDGIELASGMKPRIEISFQERISIREPRERTTVPAGPEVRLPVRWTAPPGAEHYTLELQLMMRDDDDRITGWSGIPVARDIRSETYELKVRGLELWGQARVRYGNSGLFPSAVLGAWHPGALLGVRIIAFGATGTMLSDSEGILFSRAANYPLLVVTEDRTLPEFYKEAVDTTANRDYAHALGLWEQSLSELQKDETDMSAERSDELIMAAHLALARLHARLKGELEDRNMALAHYRSLLSLADENAAELPPEIRQEAVAYGASSSN